jgi:predicted ArsR family transcriptional regulator
MSGDVDQARALGDQTRNAVFRFIADADHPVGVRELTEHFDLNHNAIRQHLGKLVAADLLIEERAAPSGRGRPRLVYSVDPGTDSRWGVTGPYERLALLLAEAIGTGATPVEVGRRKGREEAESLGVEAGPEGALEELMARNGFEPELRRDGDELDVVLHTCPFASAALADPDVVCNLHLGLAIGAAEHLGGLVVDGLDRFDPRRAPCHLRAHLEPDDGSPEANTS